MGVVHPELLHASEWLFLPPSSPPICRQFVTGRRLLLPGHVRVEVVVADQPGVVIEHSEGLGDCLTGSFVLAAQGRDRG